MQNILLAEDDDDDGVGGGGELLKKKWEKNRERETCVLLQLLVLLPFLFNSAKERLRWSKGESAVKKGG